MANKLPQISGKELSRVLIKIGFEFKNQNGSHIKFVKNSKFNKEIIIIPNHKTIRKGTLNNILKKINLSKNRFNELL